MAAGGEDAVRELLFGLAGVTTGSVRAAAADWLPHHPGGGRTATRFPAALGAALEHLAEEHEGDHRGGALDVQLVPARGPQAEAQHEGGGGAEGHEHVHGAGVTFAHRAEGHGGVEILGRGALPYHDMHSHPQLL